MERLIQFRSLIQIVESRLTPNPFRFDGCSSALNEMPKRFFIQCNKWHN